MSSYLEIKKRKSYWILQIQTSLSNLIQEHLKENTLTLTELSSKTGIKESKLKKMINCDYNWQLSEIVEVCVNLEHYPTLTFN